MRYTRDECNYHNTVSNMLMTFNKNNVLLFPIYRRQKEVEEEEKGRNENGGEKKEYIHGIGEKIIERKGRMW